MAMAAADGAAGAAADHRQSSPNTLSVNLSSNNPFRNRLSTASASSPRSLESTIQQFPFPAASSSAAAAAMSKNPFLDPGEPVPAAAEKSSSPPVAVVNNSTAQVEDIFKDLSVSEQPQFSNGPLPPRGNPARSGTLPSQQRPPVVDGNRLGPEDRRERLPRAPPRHHDSPQKRPEHRRRASESSMMEFDRRDRREKDRSERPRRTESEERRRRERRKEREERHRREKEEGGGKPKSRKPQKNLDIIDKLDVTGIYGQGLFHHDGPFDACNPHRNVKKDRRAPMQAFPEGSANMALGGSGPNRSRLDLDKFHGRTEEGFNDYGMTRKADTGPKEPEPLRGEPLRYVSATDRAEQVHGEESYGLGTSTFLEGAPASRSALQRRESEDQQPGSVLPAGEINNGGLARKKSLAQRLRGMSATRPREGGVRSPDARYHGGPVELADTQVKPSSGGGMGRAIYTKENEVNPFDTEYDRAFAKKGTEIKFAEQEKPAPGRARAPSSPSAGGSNGAVLTRSVTADSVTSPAEEKGSAGGFLNRMKSLKAGPKRVGRPERKDSS